MLRKLSCALAGESVLLLGLTATVLVALNIPAKWQDVVQSAIPLLLALAVRSITSSPATVARVATEAAVETAAALTEPVVGPLGEVTDLGREVAENVAGSVLKGVGGLVGVIAEPVTKEAA